MIVERIRKNHVPAVSDLFHNHAWPSAVGAVIHHDSYFERLIDNDIHPMYVAVEDGEILGMVIAYDMHIWCYIDYFIVNTAHRKKGVGKKLLEAVEKHKKWYCLQVNHHEDIPAIGEFFRRNGYTPEASLWKWWYKMEN